MCSKSEKNVRIDNCASILQTELSAVPIALELVEANARDS